MSLKSTQHPTGAHAEPMAVWDKDWWTNSTFPALTGSTMIAKVHCRTD